MTFMKIIRPGIVVSLILCAFLSACDNTRQDAATQDSVNVPLPVITVEDDIKDKEKEVTDMTDIDTEDPVQPDPSDSFYAEEISDELFESMQGKSWPEECTMDRGDLRHLCLLYKDIDGEVHEGQMICNARIADKLVDIFRQLYDNDYPIERMELIDNYNGDDEASMSDNNSSCFNYRVISGTKKLSKHAMGLAVDINPRYNPYVHSNSGTEKVEPANGAAYTDRSGDFPYKIDKEDLAYKLFTQAGFSWGGAWKSSKDYQHFEYNK